jgi:HPt (histidine-containing phosphotransfer) domain-containing protein
MHLEIAIPRVNTEKGLSNCGGDLQMYQALLRTYVAETPAVLLKMRDVTEESLQHYAIAAHGIKGTSANIGAEAIHEAAADLERLARNGDLLGVLAKHDALLQETEVLVPAIESWLDKQADTSTKPRLLAPDRALLASLRQRCEKFDVGGINKAMDELDSAHYDTDADLVTWLKAKVDTLDFPEIAERLAEYETEYYGGQNHLN